MEKDWLKTILIKEQKAHQDFFGQMFDLTGFQVILEKYDFGTIDFWKRLDLEPHFLPAITMSSGADFPGWKVKPCPWYYQQVAEGKVLRRQPEGSLVPDREAFKLAGITVLVDMRVKPQYEAGRQMFKDDNLLGPIILALRKARTIVGYGHGPQSSRFGISPTEWENCVKPFKTVLAEFLEVEISEVRLERIIEANVIPQLYPDSRQKDQETNTAVWYEEYWWGDSHRFHGGASAFGGLSFVSCHPVDSRWRSLAVRSLIVLG